MCDYSLHAFPNRLAIDGEQLVTHRFSGGSIGLVSPAQLTAALHKADGRRSVWKVIQSWFDPGWARNARACAVCVPPGATLVLSDIPRLMQFELKVEETETVTFIETSANVNTYRDGVRFQNGSQLLLQALREGQRVTVVTVNIPEPALSEAASAETAAV